MKISTTGFRVTKALASRPAPCIQAGGINGGNCSQYFLEPEAGGRNIGKPSFRVPSMSEIVALPWNGFKVASTFSGCGGACLGYRMAGFEIILGNEIVP